MFRLGYGSLGRIWGVKSRFPRGALNCQGFYFVRRPNAKLRSAVATITSTLASMPTTLGRRARLSAIHASRRKAICLSA